MNIALKSEIVTELVKSYDKPVSFDIGKKITVIKLVKENDDFIKHVLQANVLKPAQKNNINSYLKGMDESLGSKEVGSPKAFFESLSFLNNMQDPFLEIKISDKWYPLLCSISKFRTFTGEIVDLVPYASLGGLNYSQNLYLGGWDFEDASGKPCKKTIEALLKKNNLRIASKEKIEQAKKLSNKVSQVSNQIGKVFDATGFGLNIGYFGWQESNLGWKHSPSTVIVEPNLENQHARHQMYDTSWRLPFVRVFSFKHKAYFYADVEDLEPHVYHRDGKNKVVLPDNMTHALDAIFNAKQEQVFGDVFHGRHGGIVVLANGPSGVGKTLTAEVFAEHQERPLYTMEMGEIGTSVEEVEKNLQKIFARAKKWNAVLLFDEADIFLSERVSSDLERSAIVGIFLRLLDYYEGTFFLTTNRGDHIDKAFKSRVTLYLDYPPLSIDIREKIWKSMLDAAEMTVVNDRPWVDVSLVDLNGRQIRNQVRLLKLMYPDGKVKVSDIAETLAFAAR
jgi:hypothetical protein